MEIDLRDRLNHRISVQISYLLPDIKAAIAKELGIDDVNDIHYTSTTSFLTFNIVQTDEQKNMCNCAECIFKRCDNHG